MDLVYVKICVKPNSLQSAFSSFFFLAQSSSTAAMSPPGVCMNIVNARHQKNGFGTYENPEKFLKQDYQSLKSMLLRRRVRFIDGMFPPDRKSIGRDILPQTHMDAIVWRRPHVSFLVV